MAYEYKADRSTRVRIDKKKMTDWIAGTLKNNGSKPRAWMAYEIGVAPSSLSSRLSDGEMPIEMLVRLKERFKLNIEDVIPEEDKKRAEENNLRPAQESVNGAERAVIQELAQTGKLALQKMEAGKSLAENIARGFRVQTNPVIDTQAVTEAVKAGMEAFWRSKKAEIIDLFRGSMTSAVIEGTKKVNEMEMERKAKLTQPWVGNK